MPRSKLPRARPDLEALQLPLFDEVPPGRCATGDVADARRRCARSPFNQSYLELRGADSVARYLESSCIHRASVK